MAVDRKVYQGDFRLAAYANQLLFPAAQAYHHNCEVYYSDTKGVYVMSVETAKVCAVTDSQLLDKLTEKSEYSCARCGAKAHDRGSVCEPMPLEPDH